MLYEQINNVVDSLESYTIIKRMGALAAHLEQIKKMEEIDRARETQELLQMEKIIMAIDDDKPIQFGK